MLKKKLLLFNLAIVTFWFGLISILVYGISFGAIIVISASVLIFLLFLHSQWLVFHKEKINIYLAAALVAFLLVCAVNFIHGFSTLIDLMLITQIEIFKKLYFTAGILMVVLFAYFSIISINSTERKLLILPGIILTSLLGLSGILSFSHIIYLDGRLIFYSWVFMMFYYLCYFIYSKMHEEIWEPLKLFLVTGLLLGFWVLRFNSTVSIENELVKAILFFGFVPVLLLPMSILWAKKYLHYVVFIIYFIFLDIFFIQFDSNISYLIKVGVNGCVNYEQLDQFDVNYDAGMNIDSLFREPSKAEIKTVIDIWKHKDFTPTDVNIVNSEILENGDSLIVISHLVNGLKHYGAVRIPLNINVENAPILLQLTGGGTGIDVSNTSTLTTGKCLAQRKNFISILPSYRGNILRGNNFCFRSDGYYGNVWSGAAEDAISFLEVVKSRYKKSENSKVVANGISRGATVALIIGALTDKLDYVIANSTHTKFLDKYVYYNEKVGQSYPAAFFTPRASPDEIRMRILESSPYYFSQNLPSLELHQSTNDMFTTVWHAEKLKEQMFEIKRDTNSYKFYIYRGKRHGYDDDSIVCSSLAKFDIE